MAAVCAERPVLAAVVATALVSTLFAALPGLDRAASAAFHGPDGFAAAQEPVLVALRLAARVATRLAIAGLAVLLAAKVVAPRRVAAVPLGTLMFLAASLALGPGLAVNLVLKEFWHRPRPRDTDLFGGEHAFVPPWVPAGGCPTDCSFPSAEASAAIWWLAVAASMPASRRAAAAAAALAWAAAVSANRVAFGGHWLSDVVIAWALTLTIVLAVREVVLVRVGPERWAAIEARLAAFGGRPRGGSGGGGTAGGGGASGTARP